MTGTAGWADGICDKAATRTIGSQVNLCFMGMPEFFRLIDDSRARAIQSFKKWSSSDRAVHFNLSLDLSGIFQALLSPVAQVGRRT
jgi:hypothetical protein